ncbi:ATP-grasp domain-containing protein [Streptomyces sp. NPDC048723]|uniref:ATP-grasp domain-containing protein n=1 Tax=unclassified Streptomyces TaxID=2593676 RepID=UPI00356A2D18
MPHVAIVESNLCGLGALNAALQLGCEVTFVRSPRYEYHYAGDPQWPGLRERLHRVVEIDDTSDPAQLTDALAALHAAAPVDAVLSVMEYTVHALALAARAVGIGYLAPEAVARTRHKGQERARLWEAGIPAPGYTVVTSRRQAEEAARALGGRLVLKPAAGLASMFAAADLRSPEEVLAAYDRFTEGVAGFSEQMRAVLGTEVIIEEYLDGRMVSLELAGTGDGRYVPFAVIERKRYPKDETIELGSYAPAPLTDEQWDAVWDYGREVLRALGLDRGVFHLEMIITAEGPRLIEANPRILGGCGPVLISQTWGQDMYEALVRVHLGEEIDGFPRQPARYGVSQLLAPEADSVCASTDFSGWLPAHGEQVPAFQFKPQAGDEIRRVQHGFDYVGYFIALGPTPERARELCDDVLNRLVATTRVPLMRAD